MALHVGFTGTQQGMSPRQIYHFRHFLSTLYDPERYFHHGDCIGADVQAAAIAHYTGWQVVCHPPLNESKRGFFRYNHEIREPKAYLERNHDIVDECTKLIATPKESQEILRSGTWATIRYAKKTHKDLTIIQPE